VEEEFCLTWAKNDDPLLEDANSGAEESFSLRILHGMTELYRANLLSPEVEEKPKPRWRTDMKPPLDVRRPEYISSCEGSFLLELSLANCCE
jgi:hypothetical protein